ncbi:hypothetical protein [Rhodococcus sp. HNM0569]|uniref:hypothetical protein n=1 Tax=Rhodococcus sp. HNM0569 TaxID=2716340 RepID=UPI00146F174E|nr:hypothetical protein [Rhodococcus sp. HNM0569]NLU81769.1 hypothetical protein [Rhodococcus sp. HNM0569]
MSVDIDAAATAQAARRLLASADEIDEQVDALRAGGFGADTAGRGYRQDGAALSSALLGIADALGQWSAETRSYGRALDTSAREYADQDAAVGDRLGSMG